MKLTAEQKAQVKHLKALTRSGRLRAEHRAKHLSEAIREYRQAATGEHGATEREALRLSIGQVSS